MNTSAVRDRFRARTRLMSVRAPGQASAEAFDRALDAFLRASEDPLGHIQPVLVEYPDFVMGHILIASTAIAAKHPSMLPTLRSALDAARTNGVESTDQERAHCVAARAWLNGQPKLAAQYYTSILREWPQDLLALRLAQSCHFFLGNRQALRDVAELVWPSWNAGMPGYEHLLAMMAFGCAENGDDAWAEALGVHALAIQPAFPFAIHAVAHALANRGSFTQGALFMRQQRRHWLTAGRMVAHNVWHAAMFELESGHPARALNILDKSLIPHAARSASNAADATALLWRLQLDGTDPGTRWSLLSDCWALYTSPGYWPLLDLHAAIAFSAAGHKLRARSLAQGIWAWTRRRGPGHDARVVTLSALRAVEAFAVGAYSDVRDILRRLRPTLERIGGSHAQRELLERMLREAERCLQSQNLPQRMELGVAA